MLKPLSPTHFLKISFLCLDCRIFQVFRGPGHGCRAKSRNERGFMWGYIFIEKKLIENKYLFTSGGSGEESHV